MHFSTGRSHKIPRNTSYVYQINVEMLFRSLKKWAVLDTMIAFLTDDTPHTAIVDQH